YQNALEQLDEDMPQYIADNTDDELSHATFLNAFLHSMGQPDVNLDQFRTLDRKSTRLNSSHLVISYAVFCLKKKKKKKNKLSTCTSFRHTEKNSCQVRSIRKLTSRSPTANKHHGLSARASL